MNLNKTLPDKNADGDLHAYQLIVAERVDAARRNGTIRREVRLLSGSLRKTISSDLFRRPIGCQRQLRCDALSQVN